MSSGSRIGLVAATLVALVVAFVVLSPGDDDDEAVDRARSTTSAAPATTASPAPATTSTTGGTEPAPAQEPAPPAPAPAFVKIRVRDGMPVGGVKTITVRNGERARIEVSSPDTSDEVHLHGYDVSRDLEAGGRVRFSFKANGDGIFEIELEGSHTQIGKLVVEP